MSTGWIRYTRYVTRDNGTKPRHDRISDMGPVERKEKRTCVKCKENYKKSSNIYQSNQTCFTKETTQWWKPKFTTKQKGKLIVEGVTLDHLVCHILYIINFPSRVVVTCSLSLFCLSGEITAWEIIYSIGTGHLEE